VTKAQPEKEGHMVIYPDPIYLETQLSETLQSQYDLDFRGVGLAIRSFLGELVVRVLGKTQTRNLILTGGDTAIGVCGKLDIRQLTIVEELLPGIPLSRGHLNARDEVNIVTKAGGFGDENALYLLFEKLMNQRRPR
jgi:uncharacterized protein YgbK (DUF1537 family)